jgi:uncharacterized protein
VRKLWIWVAIIINALACGGGIDRVPSPPISPVTDLTGHYLSHGKLERLNLDLKEYEDLTHHQVWVWISDRPLPKGQSIEDFGMSTFNAWGVGREGYDDGVVLFIFPSPPGDRLRMRIQVGYGLEKVLPDRECVRILKEVVGPSLEKGQHDEGVEAGLKAIITAIEVAK